jgi:hypothetical protein
VELNQMAWKQPDDNKHGHLAAAGQPLLAELGESGYQHPPDAYTAAPVELPVADHVAQPQQHGRESYHAELADPNSAPARYTSPPQQSYSAYSPPYERSNF